MDNVKKKKKLRNRIIIGVVAVAAIALFVMNRINSSKAAIPLVLVEGASIGEVKQDLFTSGFIVSGDTQMMFAPSTAPVKAVQVINGQAVKKGDLIATFDTKDLQTAYNTAKLTYEQQYNTARNAINADDANNLYYRNEGDIINNLNAEQKLLNEQIANASDVNLTVQAAIDANTAAGAPVYANDKQYYTAVNTPRLAAIPAELTLHQTKRDQLGKLNLSTENRRNLDIAIELATAQLNNAKNALVKAQAGVRAPMNGIVTNITAVPGSMASPASPICTVQSMDDVNISLTLTRYDLEKVAVGQHADITFLNKAYNGEVESISSIALAGATGTSASVTAVLKITNPDENLKLGLEATAVINTAFKESTLRVPSSAVNTDTEGLFCYVIAADGTLAKKRVTVGVSASSYTEILSGIAEGEIVVVKAKGDIAEGIKVTTTTNPEDMLQQLTLMDIRDEVMG